ncbi:MAG: insulinase family protein [Tissierellia bacterium]|nr:insulinase family protein [Tissierellia bacterium]
METINSYKLIEKREIDNIKSVVYTFEHLGTKAKVLYIKNDDDNKTFGIGFKTTPSDSTGVCHILEHCVLNGSKKYTTKEPFMDMLGSSLQTFLNAMTYPDKTIFPVASKDDSDFKNLMDVYLDAVFNPKVLEKEEIFLQEGWHYELNEDKLSLSGVVYNEMKGALSDSESQVYDKITQYLYKNSTYENNSGGDPYEIPNLSYEDFKEFHKNYYHPSNSYIYLYGNCDAKEILEYIDKEYLSNYEYKDIKSSSAVKRNHYKDVVKETYSIANGEDEKNKDYLTMSMLSVDSSDIEASLCQSVLIQTLFNSDTSKIKKEILNNNIAEEFYAISGYGEKSSITLIAKNSSYDKIDEFKKIIIDNLRDTLKNGIDKENLKAKFKRFDLSLREQLNSKSKGVEYFNQSFMTWLYGKNPIDAIEVVDVLNDLSKKLDTRYFEEFIEKYLLDNDTNLLMAVCANAGENYKKDLKVNEELKNFYNSLSDSKKQELLDKQKSLNDYQNRENSVDEKKTLPKLEIADINSEIEQCSREILKEDDTVFLYHNIDTANINYTNIVFDTNHIDDSKLQYLNLLTDLLFYLSTENTPYEKIENLINTYGSIGLNNTCYANDQKMDTKVNLALKSIGDDQQKLFDLIRDVLLNTKFDDKNRIKELIRRKKLYFEDTMYMYGHVLTSTRNRAQYSMADAFSELCSGFSYYLFLKKAELEVENDFDNFLLKIKDVYQLAFNKKNLIVNVAAIKDDFEKTRVLVNDLKKNLKANYDKKVKRNILIDSHKEAIASSSNVEYVSKGANIKKYGYEYDHRFILLNSILSNSYLYSMVRAKGGAYGVGIGIDRISNLTTYSYRDPHIKNTLNVYDNMDEFIKNLSLDKRDLDDKKIATIGSLTSPKTPYEKSLNDLKMYINDINYEQLNEIVENVKNTSIKDLNELSVVYKKAMDENNLTVFGNKEKIEENKDIFTNILKI